MKPRKSDRRYCSVLTVYAELDRSILDMLRYDSCCPATEEDAHKIGRVMDGGGEPADRVIRLRRFAAADVPATEGRWRSFGCHVLDERNPDDVPLTDTEAALLIAARSSIGGWRK